MNLVSDIFEKVSPALTGRVARALGMSHTTIVAAFRFIIPQVLKHCLDKTRTPAGFTALVETIADASQHSNLIMHGSITEDIPTDMSAASVTHLEALIGKDTTDELVTAVMTRTQLPKDAATMATAFAGQAVMNELGQHVFGRNGDALTAVLEGQRNIIMNAYNSAVEGEKTVANTPTRQGDPGSVYITPGEGGSHQTVTVTTSGGQTRNVHSQTESVSTVRDHVLGSHSRVVQSGHEYGSRIVESGIGTRRVESGRVARGEPGRTTYTTYETQPASYETVYREVERPVHHVEHEVIREVVREPVHTEVVREVVREPIHEVHEVRHDLITEPVRHFVRDEGPHEVRRAITGTRSRVEHVQDDHTHLLQPVQHRVTRQVQAAPPPRVEYVEAPRQRVVERVQYVAPPPPPRVEYVAPPPPPPPPRVEYIPAPAPAVVVRPWWSDWVLPLAALAAGLLALAGPIYDYFSKRTVEIAGTPTITRQSEGLDTNLVPAPPQPPPPVEPTPPPPPPPVVEPPPPEPLPVVTDEEEKPIVRQVVKKKKKYKKRRYYRVASPCWAPPRHRYVRRDPCGCTCKKPRRRLVKQWVYY